MCCFRGSSSSSNGCVDCLSEAGVGVAFSLGLGAGEQVDVVVEVAAVSGEQIASLVVAGQRRRMPTVESGAHVTHEATRGRDDGRVG